MNRNKNIGKHGANMQKSVFKRYLAHMLWSRQPVLDWGDLSSLLLPQYEAKMEALVANATIWKQPINAQTVAAAEKGKVPPSLIACTSTSLQDL